MARRGHELTVLLPHASGVPSSWTEDGVVAKSVRYAPEGLERIGYGRSLRTDERLRGVAAAAAPLYALAMRRALAAMLRGGNFDLVHAHWIVPNGLIAISAAARTHLAVGLHGSDVFLAERSFLRPMVRRLLRRTELLTGCSPELVQRVVALGFKPDRARVIPYGVDADLYHPDRERRLLWRQRLGLGDEDQLLLAVGRMVTKKGFGTLLEAAPGLTERLPRLHIVLAGSGDLLPALEARGRSISDRIRFVGAVAHEDLADLYRAADALVLPAVHDRSGNVDGLPNVILEAMASGLPIVASEISGIPLAVEHERTGLLVPEGDKDALEDALLTLLSDHERAREWGRAGRLRVERDLTWDAVARRYEEAYETIFASSSGKEEVA